MQKVLLGFCLESIFFDSNYHMIVFSFGRYIVLYLLVNDRIYLKFIINYITLMAHSFSFKPWSTFSKQSDSLLTSDFLNDKLFTFKSHHRPPRGFIRFKQTVLNNGDNYQHDQQVKIWFPLWNQGGAMIVRFLKEHTSILYQHGVRDYSGKLINLYGAVEFYKDFRSGVFKIGAGLLGLNSNIDNRIRLYWTPSHKNPQISSGHKISWVSEKWNFDCCNIINYNQPSIFRNTLRLIYHLDSSQQLFFKAENNNLRPLKNINLTNLDTYYTNFQIDYIKKIDKDTKAGVEVDFTKNKLVNTSIVGSRQLYDAKFRLKGKVSLDKSISLSLQSYFKDYGRWIVGWQLKDIGNKNNSRFGLLIDLNL